MTTDIARMESNAVAVLSGANEAVAKLGEWVQALGHAQELVAVLIETPFVPDNYRPRVDPRATPIQQAQARQVAIATGTAAVLQGITLGLDPLISLQQIYLVHGRPGMYTEVKVALVISRGHEVWVDDLTDTRAVVCGRRKGTEHIERVTVTMDQARKAGWTTNQAYAKTPQDMLYARAAGRVCDRIAPDVLMGIASVEEIEDTIQTTAEVGNGTRTVRPRRRVVLGNETTEVQGFTLDPPLEDGKDTAPQRGARGAVDRPDTTAADDSLTEGTDNQPDWPAVAEPELPIVDPPAGDITSAQLRMMYGLLRTTDREDRDVALVYIAGVIGREVQSTKELGKGEARKVIDALNGEITAEPEL